LCLKEIIKNEIDIFKELLFLADQEKDAVVGNHVDALSAIVEKQQAALSNVKKAENERTRTLANIHAGSGLPEGKSRLSDIIGTAQGELHEDLKNLAAELENTAAKLRRVGMVNKMLIDTQLEYASFCINLMTGSQDTLNTYSGSGRMEKGCVMHRRLVDQTI